MAFRLVLSGGNVTDAAVINVAASGTIHPNGVVNLLSTGGQGVSPAASSSTTTMIFGVAHDYAQGASDVSVRVTPFAPGQIWEADCVNAASTAQVNLRHTLDSDLFVRNTATDYGAGNARTAVFTAIAMVGSTSGSGKLLGFFKQSHGPVGNNSTTFDS